MKTRVLIVDANRSPAAVSAASAYNFNAVVFAR